MGHVVVFGNQKGGVGKSTLAVLYAYWLAEIRRQSVCLIDLDAQANSSKSLRRFATGTGAIALFGEAETSVEMPSGQAIAIAAAEICDAGAGLELPRIRHSCSYLDSVGDSGIAGRGAPGVAVAEERSPRGEHRGDAGVRVAAAARRGGWRSRTGRDGR